MFNIRDTLANGLDELEARCSGNRQLIEVGLAQGFITMVLGTDWYQRAVQLSPDPDPWMLNGDDTWLAANPVPDDVRRIVWASRTVRLANALFTLARTGRAVTGLDTLRRRFQSRPDTRAPFMEAEVASMLVHNGCSVSIVEESGVRGHDFDLLCTVADARVSVEVTRMCGSALSVSSVRNKLHEKRDQVPADRAAVLYVHVPADWMRDDVVAESVFTKAICEFMRWSRRFNAIVLVWEEVVPFWDGGFPCMAMRPAYSNQSRHHVPNLSAFTLMPDVTGTVCCADSLLDHVQAYRERRQVPVAAE